MQEQCEDSTYPENAFAEDLKFPDCLAILDNRFPSSETQIHNVFLESEKAKGNQIKAKEQLLDINNSIKVSSDKFDGHEKERKEKNESLKNYNVMPRLWKINLINLKKEWIDSNSIPYLTAS